MTSGARLLLTFFFSLFHCELVVGGIDNFRAVTLGQEVTVMVFWSRTGHPNPGHRRAGLAWAASLDFDPSDQLLCYTDLCDYGSITHR